MRTTRLAPKSKPVKEELAYYFLGVNLFTYKLRSYSSVIYTRYFAIALKLLNTVPSLKIAKLAVAK